MAHLTTGRRGRPQVRQKHLAWAFVEAAYFAIRYQPRVERFHVPATTSCAIRFPSRPSAASLEGGARRRVHNGVAANSPDPIGRRRAPQDPALGLSGIVLGCPGHYARPVSQRGVGGACQASRSVARTLGHRSGRRVPQGIGISRSSSLPTVQAGSMGFPIADPSGPSARGRAFCPSEERWGRRWRATAPYPPPTRKLLPEAATYYLLINTPDSIFFPPIGKIGPNRRRGRLGSTVLGVTLPAADPGRSSDPWAAASRSARSRRRGPGIGASSPAAPPRACRPSSPTPGGRPRREW